jgi:hypothetical protein
MNGYSHIGHSSKYPHFMNFRISTSSYPVKAWNGLSNQSNKTNDNSRIKR